MTEATRTAGVEVLGPGLAAMPSTWEDVQSMLQLLIYRVDADDPWTRLGLLAWEGPAPTITDIDRRWQRARTLLAITRLPGWSEEAVEAANLVSERLEGAHRECLEQLPIVLQRRRREKGGGVEQWREMAEPGLAFLLATAASQGECVTVQLSAVSDLSVEVVSNPRLLPPAVARD